MYSLVGILCKDDYVIEIANDVQSFLLEYKWILSHFAEGITEQRSQKQFDAKLWRHL